MGRDPKEKRQFARHPFPLPLTLDVTGEKFSMHFRNISLGGLCFLWSSHLSRGSLINLRIPVKKKLFEVKGRVAYSKELHKRQYETGVVFVDTPNAFKAKLAGEILEIVKYRETESKRLGYELSEEDAAEKWIVKNAAKFSPRN